MAIISVEAVSEKPLPAVDSTSQKPLPNGSSAPVVHQDAVVNHSLRKEYVEMTRTYVLEHLIQEQHRKCVFYDHWVLDLTKWVDSHPGGVNVIDCLVGKDATDAIRAFHNPSIWQKRVPLFRIARLAPAPEQEDAPHLLNGVRNDAVKGPSLDDIQCSEAYRNLEEKLRRDGFYEPTMSFYYLQWSVILSIGATALLLLHFFAQRWWGLVSGAVLMGVFWHGISFCAHDAGHHSVTCKSHIDNLIGIFMASYLGGVSVTWWQLNHNTHHVVTNHIEHDPDIQHLPFLAITERLFSGVYSTYYKRFMPFDTFAQMAVTVQHYLFIPILTFGRFNMYVRSLEHLLNFRKQEYLRHRWLELAGIAFFWSWFGYGVVGHLIEGWTRRLLFIYLSHASTVILHLQITLSHFAMSTDEPEGDEVFAKKALRTTMNVDCPEWLDWFHGGLQFQVEHHLFPRVPRSHFRRLKPLVEAFAKQCGLAYHSYDFLEGNVIVHSTLATVAHQLRLILASANLADRFKHE
jgi:delta8-fatty-acid desaturase